jgi:hypothetical protein
MDIDEVLESPAFWILGGGGVATELIGFIAGKRMGLVAFPIWQLIILMAGTLVAAAFFATRD